MEQRREGKELTPSQRKLSRCHSTRSICGSGCRDMITLWLTYLKSIPGKEPHTAHKQRFLPSERGKLRVFSMLRAELIYSTFSAPPYPHTFFCPAEKHASLLGNDSLSATVSPLRKCVPITSGPGQPAAPLRQMPVPLHTITQS